MTMTNLCYKAVMRYGDRLVSAHADKLAPELIVEYLPGVRTYPKTGKLFVARTLEYARGEKKGAEIWSCEVGNFKMIPCYVRLSSIKDPRVVDGFWHRWVYAGGGSDEIYEDRRWVADWIRLIERVE